MRRILAFVLDFAIAAALQWSGVVDPAASKAMWSVAIAVGLVLLVTSPPAGPVRRFGRRHRVLSTILACVVGGALWQLLLLLPDADLQLSPARKTIAPAGQSMSFPLRVKNRRSVDLADRAFLVKFTPALPNLMDAVLVPPPSHTVRQGSVTMFSRGTHSRWTEKGSTHLLHFLDSVDANEVIEYRVEVKTGMLSSPVEMTATEVSAEKYAARRAHVSLEDSPNEALFRLLPQKVALLANSPTGTIALVLGDGTWRTASGTYQDILPLIEHDGFRLHLFRDVDDLLKLELRTPRGFAGDVVSMPVSEIPVSSVHAITFGWTEKGMGMMVDLRPTVHRGVWQ